MGLFGNLEFVGRVIGPVWEPRFCRARVWTCLNRKPKWLFGLWAVTRFGLWELPDVVVGCISLPDNCTEGPGWALLLLGRVSLRTSNTLTTERSGSISARKY